MKYFSLLAVLSVFGYESLYSMNTEHEQYIGQQTRVVNGHVQNQQQQRFQPLNFRVAAYNDLSDAMRGEEYLSGNLLCMVNNYVAALSTRSGMLANGYNIMVMYEYNRAIDNLWNSIYSEVERIFASRRSVNILADVQLALVQNPELFRINQLPAGNALHGQNQQHQLINMQLQNTMQNHANANDVR